MVRLQCPHCALAAPAPHDFHRRLSARVASSSLGPTDVFWPVLPPRVAAVAIAGPLPGPAQGRIGAEEGGCLRGGGGLTLLLDNCSMRAWTGMRQGQRPLLTGACLGRSHTAHPGQARFCSVLAGVEGGAGALLCALAMVATLVNNSSVPVCHHFALLPYVQISEGHRPSWGWLWWWPGTQKFVDHKTGPTRFSRR